MKKRRRKKTPVQTLHKKVDRIRKILAFLRDGKECQVKKHFPEIKLPHTKVMQVDHFISRGNKVLYYHPSNQTVVCSYCNFAKCYKLNSVDILIQRIVKMREGVEMYEWLIEQDTPRKTNFNWDKIWWLETVLDSMELDRLKLNQCLNL